MPESVVAIISVRDGGSVWRIALPVAYAVDAGIFLPRESANLPSISI